MYVFSKTRSSSLILIIIEGGGGWYFRDTLLHNVYDNEFYLCLDVGSILNDSTQTVYSDIEFWARF